MNQAHVYYLGITMAVGVDTTHADTEYAPLDKSLYWLRQRIRILGMSYSKGTHENKNQIPTSIKRKKTKKQKENLDDLLQ